ncbi:hypothetical protein ACLG6S_08595 [Thermodesulfobacteriota bacterium B35]
MNRIFEWATWIFDPLNRFYEHEKVHRKISVLLVLFFIFSLLVIELKRRALLPDALARVVPGNHFYAIGGAFTVILVLEVISLIFVLPCSFSRSVGKQFEILSLILMRNAFKELSHFQEPVTFAGNEQGVLHILSDGFGAVVIFGLLGVYYFLQRKCGEKGDHIEDLYSFVAAKKGIALLLLTAFLFMGIQALYATVLGDAHGDFFHDFYTLLIITDILLVLVAQCFHPTFYSVFRNSGFALSTMIIRFALVAPVYYNVLLGLAAIGLAILMHLISMYLFPER